MITKLNMYRQVSDVIQEHSTDWAGIQVFGNAAARFEQELQTFESLLTKSENVQTGVKASKDTLQKEIFEKVLGLTRVLKVYAVQNFEVGLVAQLKPITANLKRSSKQQALTMIEFVLSKANERSSDLNPYGIDQEKLTRLEILKKQYAISIHSTRKAIVERKSINELIATKDVEIFALLVKELDPFVKNMKADFQEFYSKYFAARIQVRSGFHKNRTASAASTVIPIEPDDGSVNYSS